MDKRVKWDGRTHWCTWSCRCLTGTQSGVAISNIAHFSKQGCWNGLRGVNSLDFINIQMLKSAFKFVLFSLSNVLAALLRPQSFQWWRSTDLLCRSELPSPASALQHLVVISTSDHSCSSSIFRIGSVLRHNPAVCRRYSKKGSVQRNLVQALHRQFGHR